MSSMGGQITLPAFSPYTSPNNGSRAFTPHRARRWRRSTSAPHSSSRAWYALAFSTRQRESCARRTAEAARIDVPLIIMISCVFRVTRTSSDPRNYLQKTTRRRKACAHHCWWWCMHHSRRRSLRSVPPVSHAGVRNSAASVVQRGQTVPGDRPADPNCDGNALDLTDARRRTHADAG
jgi:hypothetical protein